MAKHSGCPPIHKKRHKNQVNKPAHTISCKFLGFPKTKNKNPPCQYLVPEQVLTSTAPTKQRHIPTGATGAQSEYSTPACILTYKVCSNARCLTLNTHEDALQVHEDHEEAPTGNKKMRMEINQKEEKTTAMMGTMETLGGNDGNNAMKTERKTPIVPLERIGINPAHCKRGMKCPKGWQQWKS